jgi:hypothetical protein
MATQTRSARSGGRTLRARIYRGWDNVDSFFSAGSPCRIDTSCRLPLRGRIASPRASSLSVLLVSPIRRLASRGYMLGTVTCPLYLIYQPIVILACFRRDRRTRRKPRRELTVQNAHAKGFTRAPFHSLRRTRKTSCEHHSQPNGDLLDRDGHADLLANDFTGDDELDTSILLSAGRSVI